MYFFLIIIYKSKMYYRSEPEEWDSRLKSTLLFLGYRHICPDHIGIMWFRIIDLKKTVFMWNLFIHTIFFIETYCPDQVKVKVKWAWNWEETKIRVELSHDVFG